MDPSWEGRCFGNVAFFPPWQLERRGNEVWTSGKWISYEGAWKEGLQHGRGILTDKRGMVRVTRVDGSRRNRENGGSGWGEKGPRFCGCK